MTTRLTAAVLATALLAAGFAVSTARAATCPGPDLFGHTCLENSAGCEMIAAAFNPMTQGDDTCVVRNLGFTYNFYGVAYTQVGVGSNGQMVLGGCGAGSTRFGRDCPIPNANTPNGAVYGIWTDLNPASIGVVQDATVGAAPNRTYVVEFRGVPFFGSTVDLVTFQVHLLENGGAGERARVVIERADRNTFTTGMENQSGTDALMRHCNNGANTGPFTPTCTEYTFAPAPPPPTGDCADQASVDFIESKLDSQLDESVSSRASQDSVDDLADDIAALRAELAAFRSFVAEMNCETLRLLHTPQGQRTTCSAAVENACGTTYSWNSQSTGGPLANPQVCP